jgi:hypothetical protein
MQATILALLFATSSLLVLADPTTANPVTVGPATVDGTNSTVDPNWTPPQNLTAGPVSADRNHAEAGPAYITTSKICLGGGSGTCVGGGPCTDAGTDYGYRGQITADQNGVEVMVPAFNVVPGVRAGVGLAC